MLLVFLIATAGGCVLNPLSVPVTYQPESSVSPVTGAPSVHVHVVGEDQRADKTSVGQYGSQSVATSNNVADTARDAVQTELQARGFVIDNGAAGSEVRVEVQKLDGYFFSTLIFSSYTAEMIMHVEVERAGKVVAYSRSFDVTDTYHPTMFGSVSDDFRPGAERRTRQRSCKAVRRSRVHGRAATFKARA